MGVVDKAEDAVGASMGAMRLKRGPTLEEKIRRIDHKLRISDPDAERREKYIRDLKEEGLIAKRQMKQVFGPEPLVQARHPRPREGDIEIKLREDALSGLDGRDLVMAVKPSEWLAKGGNIIREHAAAWAKLKLASGNPSAKYEDLKSEHYIGVDADGRKGNLLRRVAFYNETERKAVRAILVEAIRKLDALRASNGESWGRIDTDVAVLMGDFHGSVWFVKALAEKADEIVRQRFPGMAVTFVQSGDMIDRGPLTSVETLLYFIHQMLLGNLIVIKGNHEDMLAGTDFMPVFEEILLKFSSGSEEEGMEFVKLFDTLLRKLLHMAVINGFLLVHGFLSMDMVQKVAVEGMPLDRYALELSKEENRQSRLQVLWNDVDAGMDQGFVRNEPRMAGATQDDSVIYIAGMDAVRRFLKASGLRGIFRGHEYTKEGFHAEGGVLTVSSCPNYEGYARASGNKVGMVLCIRDRAAGKIRLEGYRIGMFESRDGSSAMANRLGIPDASSWEGPFPLAEYGIGPSASEATQ